MSSRLVSAVSVSGAVLSVLFGSSLARAEDAELPASDALPGIHRVGVAGSAPAALAGTFGYGFSEPQSAGDGAHHRLSLRAAAAMPVIRWLSIGAVVDGRYDQHRDDSGAVIDSALQVRASTALGNWQLGGGLVGRLPGAESFAAMARGTSFDAQALLATTLERVRFASMAGYRLNRTGSTERDAARLSSGDRFALGVSDSDAVLLGLGVAAWVGKTELLAEVSADLLVGSRAPAFLQSPLRVAAGVRRVLSPGLSLEVLTVASLSKQPDLSAAAPLVPNEPRFSAFGGVRYQFLPAPVRTLITPPEVAPSSALAQLELIVLDEQGAPVARPSASVTVLGVRREVGCDDAGHCRVDDASPGQLTVRVEAPDFEPVERPVTVRVGAPTRLELRLIAVPPPSQLRGVVRSLDGKAIAARVRVEPLGAAVNVDEKGSFQLDLPPGGYDVVIEAAGFVSQRRHVQVEHKGVVVLNADLVEKR